MKMVSLLRMSLEKQRTALLWPAMGSVASSLSMLLGDNITQPNTKGRKISSFQINMEVAVLNALKKTFYCVVIGIETLLNFLSITID
jgi:hypothetical protein